MDDQSQPVEVLLTINAVDDAAIAVDDSYLVSDVGHASYGSFIYTPNQDFNGWDSFLYYVTDPSGAMSTFRRESRTIVAVLLTPPMLTHCREVVHQPVFDRSLFGTTA